MKLSLDLTNYREESGLSLIPVGTYAVEIVSTEGVQQQSHNGYSLLVNMSILRGPQKGLEIQDRITIYSDFQNDKGERIVENIGRGRLKKICQLAGLGTKIDDSNQLHGKKMMIVNDHRPDKENSDKIYNDIKKYLPFSEEDTEIPPVIEEPKEVKKEEPKKKEAAKKSKAPWM